MLNNKRLEFSFQAIYILSSNYATDATCTQPYTKCIICSSAQSWKQSYDINNGHGIHMINTETCSKPDACDSQAGTALCV
jgi:hypothetical protein